MSANLIETIQKNLGYPPLHKVDPVNHEVKNADRNSSRERLAQAAIPAVLAVLYKYTRSEKGRNTILSGNKKGSWLDTILEKKENAAVDKVAHYAGVQRGEAEQAMEQIADEAVRVATDSMGKNPSQENLKTMIGSQRHGILVYLPAVLQMGSLLEDDTLDDRTNKMEGPMSNLMHNIEDKFSSGGGVVNRDDW
jgi:hypothetical protein